MMLVIEYLNVMLRGSGWLQQFKGGWQQYIVAGLLGALPGCLGPWAVVALYSHGLVTLGALTTAMIATSGDEAYLMLAVIPEQAFWLFGGLLVLGILAGILTDVALRGRDLKSFECAGLAFHAEDAAIMFARGFVFDQWRKPSRLRLLLGSAFLIVAALILTGIIGPEEWDWIRVVSLLTSSFALIVVVLVPDHFLEDHLWGHVIRRHALRIFLWTLGALSVTHVIVDVLKLDTLSPEGRWTMLGIACLVGLIPQSGPHMMFVTMFASGALPLSVLIANSIVQDGHGAIPLLAESRKAFILVKAINMLVGLMVGAALLGLGF
jgi:putative 10TM heavy-metal exporter